MPAPPPLGPYELVRRLGVGGMAETFEAKRPLGPTSTQRVCIKRVLPAYANDPSYLALFQREARLATRLRHPNIVAVLDAGEDGEHGDPYLVLELVDGIDLRALLATAPHHRLGPDVTSYLAMELAYALAYAHAASEDRPAIVHRDLSPSNVLLSRGGDVKLADFGLAKPVHGHDVTQSGSMRGKIPYLPPEQMRGEHVDARADLFALGVVLYECLAGRRPFDGAHEVETMTRVLSDRRDPITVAAPDTPPALAELVERLLAHDRRGRPESALEVVHALDALPPPIRARLRLLDLVETRLGGSDSRRHVRVDRHGERLTPARTLAPLTESCPPAADADADCESAADPDSCSDSDPGTLAGPTRREAPRIKDGLRTGTRRGPPSETMRRRPSSRTVRTESSTAAPATTFLGVPAGTHDPTARRNLARTARATRSTWLWRTLGAVVIVASGAAVGSNVGREHRVPTKAGTVVRAESARPTSAVRAVAASADAPAVQPPTGASQSSPGETTRTAQGADAGILRAPEAPVRLSRTEGRTGTGTSAASVRVVVHPWGLVWVDGRALGRAPRGLTLAPGTHRIEVGQDRPRASRSIHVAAGDRRFLQFDLAESPDAH